MPHSAASDRNSRVKPPRPSIRRKNLNVDQDKLDRAVELLGARSETDAIDQALDLLLFREELVTGVRRIAGTGGFENYFDDEEVTGT